MMSSSSLQHAATHCNTLQNTATHCSTLQHAATHCNSRSCCHGVTTIYTQVSVMMSSSSTATHCNTLPHTATHCNTLQHTATHCNTLQHTATHYNTRSFCHGVPKMYMSEMMLDMGVDSRDVSEKICVITISVASQGLSLSLSFSCSVLQTDCCSVLQCVAVCCSLLQFFTVFCSVLQGCDYDLSRLTRSLSVSLFLLQCAADGLLQCVAVYCSVLQCFAVCCRDVITISVASRGQSRGGERVCRSVLQRAIAFYNVLQCNVLQRGAVCFSCVAVCCSVFQSVSECCSVLQCVAACCSVLQRGAVCFT